MSNSRSLSYDVTKKMRWLLKSSFDENLIVINHNTNSDFKSHIIIKRTQKELVTLLVSEASVSLLIGHFINTMK
jgi:hypothetical protein